MKTFKEFLLEQKPLTRKQLLEGGNAIKSSSMIHQNNVKDTLENIYKTLLPKLKLSKLDVKVLGSTGKKDPSKSGSPEGSSGDIDLAIDIKALMKNNNLSTVEECLNLLKDVAKEYTEYKIMSGINVFSIAFPISNIDGKQENKFVQLDLMPVEDLNYSAWAYHSPSYNESKYKGAYRNEILYAIAKFTDMKILKSEKINGKNLPVRWERYFYDLSKGLMRGIQSIEGKNGIIKTPKTLEKWLVTTDVNKITKLLFGENIAPKDVMTWESTWEIINSNNFKNRENINDIVGMIKDGIKTKGLPLPEELR